MGPGQILALAMSAALLIPFFAWCAIELRRGRKENTDKPKKGRRRTVYAVQEAGEGI